MNCLLATATIAGISWALIQGLFPLLLDLFISNPNDYTADLDRIIKYRQIFAYISICIIVAILVITIIGFII